MKLNVSCSSSAKKNIISKLSKGLLFYIAPLLSKKNYIGPSIGNKNCGITRMIAYMQCKTHIKPIITIEINKLYKQIHKKKLK